ncbi:MAG: transglycosylase [Bradyrhizobium sp.]|nr:transglycosylase [Bradyrhizobium sp.]
MKIWQVSCVVGTLIAISFAAIHQIAVSRADLATPNAIVADAFSVMRLDMMTILAKARAAYPTSSVGAKLNTTTSVNSIIAAEFAATAQVAERVAYSLRQGPPLPVHAGFDAPENEATLQEASIPATASSPVKIDVKIDLAALSDVPLGTPVQEIDRAAEAFGLDANFMKTVAKIESDLNPRDRTGSYIGLFQLSRSEFRQYGSGDILNPRDNAMAAARKFITEAALFEETTHRKLTFADLYLIHQQGLEGAAEHISHPGQIAWKSVCATHEGMAKGERWCKRAIWGNTLPAVKRQYSSVDRLTSGAFVAMWRNQIDMLLSHYAAPAPLRPEV